MTTHFDSIETKLTEIIKDAPFEVSLNDLYSEDKWSQAERLNIAVEALTNLVGDIYQELKEVKQELKELKDVGANQLQNNSQIKWEGGGSQQYSNDAPTTFFVRE